MNNPKCGIIIHNIVHARAALEASSATKVPIAIVSAPYAGCYAGVSWFLKIEEKIQRNRALQSATRRQERKERFQMYGEEFSTRQHMMEVVFSFFETAYDGGSFRRGSI